MYAPHGALQAFFRICSLGLGFNSGCHIEVLVADGRLYSPMDLCLTSSSNTAELFLLRLPCTDPRTDLLERVCESSMLLCSEAAQGLIPLDE